MHVLHGFFTCIDTCLACCRHSFAGGKKNSIPKKDLSPCKAHSTLLIPVVCRTHVRYVWSLTDRRVLNRSFGRAPNRDIEPGRVGILMRDRWRILTTCFSIRIKRRKNRWFTKVALIKRVLMRMLCSQGKWSLTKIDWKFFYNPLQFLRRVIRTSRSFFSVLSIWSNIRKKKWNEKDSTREKMRS